MTVQDLGKLLLVRVDNFGPDEPMVCHRGIYILEAFHSLSRKRETVNHSIAFCSFDLF